MVLNRSITETLAEDFMKEVKGTPKYTLVIIALVVAAIVFSGLFYYDIKGSVIGFQSLEVQSLGPAMPYLIGLIPQLVQFILSGIVVRAMRIGARVVVILAIIWIVAFVIDAGTDYAYLSATCTNFVCHLTAVIIAGPVLTIFSDWFLTLVLSMLFLALPDIIPGIVNIARSAAKGMGVGELTQDVQHERGDGNRPRSGRPN